MRPDIVPPQQRHTPKPSQANQTSQQPQTPRGFASSPPPPDMSLPSNQPKPKRSWLKTSSKSTKIIIASIVIAFIATVLALASAVIWYRSQLTPLGSNDAAYRVVVIDDGMSSAEIAKTLEDEQLIRSATAFRWHLKISGQSSGLQAGVYRLSSRQSVEDIAAILYEGKVNTVDVLIPPGLRLDEIKQRLIKFGYDEISIDDALIRVRDHKLVSSLPDNIPLEGYLFPDTYRIGPSIDAETLFRLMLDRFDEQIDDQIARGLSEQKISLRSAIIVASIVQKEVPDYETQRMVAQVFLKRLKEGMPLGADPTFKYAAAMTGETASPQLDSPYNTRLYSGLPPSAIANFNISALRAVANPSETDYTYFVSGDDGRTHFTNTIEEHDAATRRYCTELCS